ncbi:GOLPH3/VPS74 family protein [Streptomyces beijiangensis]|uniref:GPP34 family phosphoprotein n=1 Tax=Streptomyces beijiangensis TaxID=163361 RepID=A0A939JF95_9ACTN|nr:GPP34 family phosphoprotein [Streptomyces beijiangensis]MBO0512163.1 GPP34 family phosphoprotein [Streptomyces beijiangensis]
MNPAPDLTLPEELLLLALDPVRGKPRCRNRFLEYGMAGAALAELELQGRIVEERGRVAVVMPLPPEDRRLARVLAMLPPPGKSRFSGAAGTRRWVRHEGRTVEGLYLDDLVEHGVLRREKRRALGIFPYVRHPAGAAGWSALVRTRFAQAEAASFPDRRSRLLASFALAVDLTDAFPGSGWRARSALRSRIRGEWAPDAVLRNVRQDKSSESSN